MSLFDFLNKKKEQDNIEDMVHRIFMEGFKVVWLGGNGQWGKLQCKRSII